MKAKQWVELFKPAIIALDNGGNSDEFTDLVDKFYADCFEIITLRTSKINPENIRSEFEMREYNMRATNGIREATVKVKAVTNALRKELNAEILPFPLVDCMMFIPYLNKMLKGIDDPKLNFLDKKFLYETAKTMAKDLIFLNDKLVNSFLTLAKSKIQDEKNKNYLTKLAEVANLVSDAGEIAKKTNRSVFSVLMGMDGAKETMLALKQHENQVL